jgi:apolipoprotein N-acyltransferase
MTEALARQRATAAGREIGLAARIRRYADTKAGLALALGSGALAAFALPPVFLVPLLLISLPLLLWLLAGAPGPLRAGLIGFAFGMGHHIVGLYWISHSLLIDPWRHGWLIPLLVGGLAAILAIFIGLAAAAARALAGRKPLPLLLGFAAFWTFGEWLRGWVFTGFPWNLLGSVWVWSDPMVQLASVTGTWGLSLLTLLALGAPAILGEATAPRWQRIIAVPMILLLLGANFLFGSERLAGSAPANVDNVLLRLVQPDIPQTLKWDASLAEDHVLKLIRMSTQGDAPHKITDVIWPETAVPFSLERNPGLAQALAAAVPPGGLLITGIPRVSQTNAGPAWHNGMVALDGTGAVRASFDKFHLVPFGEYVPIRWIPGVDRIAPGETDFSPGPGPRTLELPGLPPVSPLICYEVIFPGAVVDPRARPAWLLNLTNDAWFGLSTGPHQHFASARLRAIEEGLPLVRVANTGISGVVDPYGRVLAKLDLGREGVIDTSLPRALPPTPYARFGDWIAGTIMLIVLVFAVGARRI